MTEPTSDSTHSWLMDLVKELRTYPGLGSLRVTQAWTSVLDISHAEVAVDEAHRTVEKVYPAGCERVDELAEHLLWMEVHHLREQGDAADPLRLATVEYGYRTVYIGGRR